MSIRPLDILDLPLIARYRNEALTLDSTRVLTRGNPLSASGMLAYINPSRHIYSAISDEDKVKWIAGIVNTRGEALARLLYLAPESNLNHDGLPALFEHLTVQAGGWGAFHVIAEVDETSDVFVALRQAGFSVYAWQRMWDISNLSGNSEIPDHWSRSRSANFSAVQSLYQQIVPPLLHPFEPISKGTRGLICDTNVKCYVSVITGSNGIVLMPLIHPEARDVGVRLQQLMLHLPERRNRPIYLIVRSYQAWLEPVLEDLGAKSTPRQAVMVKHLARLVKNGQAVPAVPPGVTVQPSRVSRFQSKQNE